jgi:hypothetical protein
MDKNEVLRQTAWGWTRSQTREEELLRVTMFGTPAEARAARDEIALIKQQETT